MTARMGPLVAIVVVNWIIGGVHGAQYLGKFIGKLSELHHGVSGEVYAVDGRTLYLKDFTYDGQGPAAYFYASTSKTANSAGFRLRDENGSPEVIRRYRKEGLTLTLPEGKTLNNIKLFYVWCEEFEVNFGEVKIARNFDYPRPQKIEPLKGVHAISSDNIVIVDAQTLLIPSLSYDGEAPDAKFWVGRGPKPSPQGIRVPDENGKEVPLRRYDRKTVVLTLPGDLTVFDIGHFGIWCEAFTVDFGHVQIPQTLNVPPSLKMLGVSPQSKLNCEVLHDDLAFEVRWAVAGDSIVLQLVAKLESREYMSFGVSGDDSHSVMIGGDVVVAWVDKQTLKGFADDYYLDAKSQCSGPSGSCPDTKLGANTNSIRLLNAAMVNGYSIITYQRSLKPSDKFDRAIYTNRSQPIIWAIGPLNQRDEVSFHSHYTKGDRLLDFGRPAKWNCPMPESEAPPMKPVTVKEVTQAPTTSAPRSRGSERRRGGSNRGANKQEVSETPKTTTKSRQRGASRDRTVQRGSSNVVRAVPTPAPVKKREAWDIPAIQCHEPEDGVFYAQMGPTGGKKGYPAITGHVGWGISWYINGLLIPEINVVRGKTYTFVVEGGFDPEVAAKYHPFYITDDSVGGYEYKTPEEKKNIRIFAGALVAKDGTVKPTGTGRLCHWTQQGDLEADDFESFGAYQRTLELKCDQGEPGVIQWTPDRETPDTVYYQCFTHRYLGWKINVLDSCDAQGAASELQPVVVSAPSSLEDQKGDLEESPSIRVETRVKPNDLANEDKSEDKKTAVSAQPLDPPIDGQSQPQLPKVPILIQPQQGFFNPPPIFMSNGPYFAQPGYNPYIFEHPFYYNPYQQSFKPSPLIEMGPPKPSETATTTTTTTTTTTEKPATVTPQFSGKLVVAASAAVPNNQTFLMPPNLRKKNNFANAPNFRRQGPKHRPYPMKMSGRPVRPYVIYKKPVYRTPARYPMFYPPQENRPMIYSEPKRRPPIYVAPQVTTPEPPPTVRNVEISPLQASTEKESEIQTAPPPVLSKPAKVSLGGMFSYRPALNTGFHPETLVVESGFKPIVTKEFQKRNDEEPELEYESEIGIIDQEPRLPEFFEPMFVPSPVDKPLKNKRMKLYKIKKVVIKHPRSLEDDAEEPVAAAAERVESYYLPPLGRQTKIPAISRQPSNIDIESPVDVNIDSPPDIVVTYDGKKVSGASLTAKIADRSSILDQRASKAAELIKARPQFAPFKGELPPLNLQVINRNAPQLQARGFISRDLDTPAIKGGSTKLSLVRQVEGEAGEIRDRVRRAAHHTPEHTEEQQKQQRNGTETGGAGCFRISLGTVAAVVVVHLLKSL